MEKLSRNGWRRDRWVPNLTSLSVSAFQFSDRPKTFRLLKAFLLGKGGKTLAQPQGGGCSVDGKFQSQVGWGSEQPDLVEGLLTPCRVVEPLKFLCNSNYSRILGLYPHSDVWSRQSPGTDLSWNGGEFPFPKDGPIKFLLCKS